MGDNVGHSGTPDYPVRVEDSEIFDAKEDQFQPVNSNHFTMVKPEDSMEWQLPIFE